MRFLLWLHRIWYGYGVVVSSDNPPAAPPINYDPNGLWREYFDCNAIRKLPRKGDTHDHW